MPNPFDQFDQPGPVTVGTPRPPKKEIREVGGSLGVVDPTTGSFTPTYTPPEKDTAKDPNGTQGLAAGFYGRALYANQKYGSGVAPRDPLTQGVVDILPRGVANAFTGTERQQADTYARDFVAATLRKESGAAISPEEYQNQYVRYFPMPGDSAETIAAKARLRDTAISSLRNQAGPAASAAEQSVAQMIAQDAQGGGNGPDGPAKRMTPEQQQQFFNVLQTQGPDAANDYLKQFNLSLVSKEDAAKPHSSAIDYSAADAQTQQRIDALKADQGAGTGSAIRRGALDAVTLGFGDEIRAGARAADQSLSGQGAFGDLYSRNLGDERAYQSQLQQEHPLPFLGGQVVGSLALPTFGASSAGELARIAALYGGAYGAGSGTDVQSRLTGGATGAGAGGALGFGAGKLSSLLRGRQQQVPELVDPATGSLNEPLEAAGPAARVGAAQEFGVNLPMGAAGDRSAAIIEKGLDNLPGSAGVMNDARRVAEGQVQNAVQDVANRYGSARTLNEAGAELQRGAQERIERGATVATKAYNAIPITDTAPASKSNAIATLQQLTGRFQSNPDLAEAMRDPKLSTYLNALQSGDLTWKDLKDFRTIIGEKIGDMRFGEGHSTSDLRALYGALSEDMRTTAASMGPGATKAFERANNLYRNEQQLIDNALVRVLGKDGQMNPEKAAAAVQAMTKGGKSTGDLKTLAQIRSATVKSGAWDEIASTLIRLGGQPANSQGRAFDPRTFVQWYADMAEPARKLLFGNGELRGSLDKFVAVNQRLANSNALRNTSQTVPNFVGTGFAGAAGAAAMLGHVGTLMGIGAEMAGNFAMAKVWTNPGFVRWATGFSRATNPAAAKSQIGRLAKIAATNPELREPLAAIQQRLLSAVNDNFTAPIAASGSDNAQQNENDR
jgi:hypothetical protein